jgi:hypothetical protein
MVIATRLAAPSQVDLVDLSFDGLGFVELDTRIDAPHAV